MAASARRIGSAYPDWHAQFAQTRQQYESFRAQRLTALGQVLENERQLRSLTGLPVEDGHRLVPIDSPTLVDASRLVAETPASLPGAVDVTVMNVDGKSATLSLGFLLPNADLLWRVVRGRAATGPRQSPT